MDEILHLVRNPGMVIPLYYQQTNGCQHGFKVVRTDCVHQYGLVRMGEPVSIGFPAPKGFWVPSNTLPYTILDGKLEAGKDLDEEVRRFQRETPLAPGPERKQPGPELEESAHSLGIPRLPETRRHFCLLGGFVSSLRFHLVVIGRP